MDWHVDKLYEFLPELGVTTLVATHSRYVVDLNRDTAPPLVGSYLTSVVPRETTHGRPLYDVEPTEAEAEERLTVYYAPYHEQLRRALEQVVREFGRAYLFDLHSFFVQSPKDICLGNCAGSTCSQDVVRGFEEAFRLNGFDAIQSDTLGGGHITRHYGSVDGVQSLQIEIRYPLYLDQDWFGEEEIAEWDSGRFRRTQRRLRDSFDLALHRTRHQEQG
jgi:N-formylglutamate amidohydrolase